MHPVRFQRGGGLFSTGDTMNCVWILQSKPWQPWCVEFVVMVVSCKISVTCWRKGKSKLRLTALGSRVRRSLQNLKVFRRLIALSPPAVVWSVDGQPKEGRRAGRGRPELFLPPQSVYSKNHKFPRTLPLFGHQPASLPPSVTVQNLLGPPPTSLSLLSTESSIFPQAL